MGSGRHREERGGPALQMVYGQTDPFMCRPVQHRARDTENDGGGIKMFPPADCRLPSVKAVRSLPAPFKPPAAVPGSGTIIGYLMGVDTVLLDHPQFSRPVC